MKPFSRYLISLLLTGVFILALAQMPPTSPLVGTWQTSIELGQGLPPATGIFQAQPDGRYREELYVQNQLAAFWEGTYTLASDGTLTQTETGKSPPNLSARSVHGQRGSGDQRQPRQRPRSRYLYGDRARPGKRSDVYAHLATHGRCQPHSTTAPSTPNASLAGTPIPLSTNTSSANGAKPHRGLMAIS